MSVRLLEHNRRRLCALLLIAVSIGSTVRAQAPSVDELIAAGDHEQARRVLDRALDEDPADATARFRRARVRGYLGDAAGALGDYDRLVATDPDNVDYVFGRAQALAWLGRDAEALAALERATRLAPGYEDVWRLRYRVQERQNGAAAEIALTALRQAASQRFPSASWWRAEPAAGSEDARAFALTLGLTVQSLDRSGASLPGWDEQFAEFSWRRSDDLTLIAGLTRSSRFSATDTSVLLGAERRLDDRWTAGARIGAAIDADFLPTREFIAHLHRVLPHGWGGELRFHRREFDTATVSAWRATAERYFGDFRAAYAFGLAHLHRANESIGHTASLTWYADAKSSYGVTLSAGEEAEAVGPGQVLVSDVSAVVLTGRHALGDRYELRWWAGTHEQGDFYRRHYAGLAVQFRF
ncbi:MAG: YaiO family outer membrane beta-barrel protein [Woeseiaceae bacterium]|nr:YaiO family outer membrane beta-barrel protein [Woeseiaceae bacterium]